MPAGNQAERKLAVKLEEVEWWQKPPVLRRERLHAGGVTEIRQRRTGGGSNDSSEPMTRRTQSSRTVSIASVSPGHTRHSDDLEVCARGSRVTRLVSLGN